MYLKIILAVIFISGIACKKDNKAGSQPKSATELLTQDTWILKSYGFDDNANNIVDPGEDLIQECEKDNTYIFNTDGTGLYSDGVIICGNGIIENPFRWKFTEQETVLDFGNGIARIFRLSEDELILYYEINLGGPPPLKILTIYGH